MPRRLSRSDICWLMVNSDTLSRAVASENPPASTTATKLRRSRTSISLRRPIISGKAFLRQSRNQHRDSPIGTKAASASLHARSKRHAEPAFHHRRDAGSARPRKRGPARLSGCAPRRSRPGWAAAPPSARGHPQRRRALGARGRRNAWRRVRGADRGRRPGPQHRDEQRLPACSSPSPCTISRHASPARGPVRTMAPTSTVSSAPTSRRTGQARRSPASWHRRLLPPVDWVVDLHSGGAAHEFVLSSNLQATVGSAEYAEMLPDPDGIRCALRDRLRRGRRHGHAAYRHARGPRPPDGKARHLVRARRRRAGDAGVALRRRAGPAQRARSYRRPPGSRRDAAGAEPIAASGPVAQGALRAGARRPAVWRRRDGSGTRCARAKCSATSICWRNRSPRPSPSRRFATA